VFKKNKNKITLMALKFSLQKSFEYVEIIFFKLKFDKITPKRKKKKAQSPS